MDKITGKRIMRKGCKSQSGKKFETLKEAYAETIRVKNDFLQTQGYSDYGVTFKQFMNNVYIPHYKTEVMEDTFESQNPTLKILLGRFEKKPLQRLLCMIFNFSEHGYWIKVRQDTHNPMLQWSLECSRKFLNLR